MISSEIYLEDEDGSWMILYTEINMLCMMRWSFLLSGTV